MKKVIIGTFYSTQEQAEKAVKDKSRIYKSKFFILKAKNGFVAVSARQLDKQANKSFKELKK